MCRLCCWSLPVQCPVSQHSTRSRFRTLLSAPESGPRWTLWACSRHVEMSKKEWRRTGPSWQMCCLWQTSSYTVENLPVHQGRPRAEDGFSFRDEPVLNATRDEQWEPSSVPKTADLLSPICSKRKQSVRMPQFLWFSSVDLPNRKGFVARDPKGEADDPPLVLTAVSWSSVAG